MSSRPKSCPISGVTDARRVFVYTEPPEGEIRFELNEGQSYYREIWQFTESRHYVSTHRMDLSKLYAQEYVNANYKDLDGIRKSFNNIMSLPPELSDNSGRVRRINEIATARFGDVRQRSLLDVGCGLGVFPYAMKQAGWGCTAVDPDERTVSHAREFLGVDAVEADFMQASALGQFDLITFNKVLEHVEDPIDMLAKSRQFLASKGLVYVEVPDGELAEHEGKGREEFFVDHLHIFSISSLCTMADRSGYTPLLIERLREPSTKFTLRAFLSNLEVVKNNNCLSEHVSDREYIKDTKTLDR